MPKGTIPSIKILPGSVPLYSRLTMPTGTFLDNPATSADAFLGGGAGALNIPQAPQVGGAALGAAPQISRGGSFGNLAAGLQVIKNWWNAAPGSQSQPLQMYNALGQPISGYEQKNIYNGKEEVSLNPVAYDQSGNRFTWDATTGQYQRDSTGVLPSKSPTSTQANSLVGSDYLKSPPSAVTIDQLKALYPGKSMKDMQDLMSQVGYSFDVHANRFVPQQISTNKASGASFGASLQPGERARGEDGNFYVGGTPTAEGQSQYAITVSQNLNKKMEAKGDYRWNSKVVKNDDGSWARIYWKELRPVGQGKKQSGAYEQGNAHAAGPNFSGNSRNQLVTLRANYG